MDGAPLDHAVCGLAEQLTWRIRPHSPNSTNDVYLGHVALPNGARRARAYVKVFPPAARGQLVYNEILGHQLALQCGLPSPFTFACACHRSLLRAGSLSIMAPDPQSEFVMGVASVDGNATEMHQTISESAAAWADVMNWPPIARVAVFDELMGNDDRHFSNLIRRAPHDYLLIDNERILFGRPWFGMNLDALVLRRCDPNILAGSLGEATDEFMRRRMIDIAQRMIADTVLQVPDNAWAVEQLCRAPQGTTVRLIKMLNERRRQLPGLLQWHLQKSDLFKASTNR